MQGPARGEENHADGDVEACFNKSSDGEQRPMLARNMGGRDADTSLCGSVSTTKMPNSGV